MQEDVSFPIYVNDQWRVAFTGLYELQRRKGALDEAGKNWSTTKFCRTIENLIDAIDEHCGEPHPDAAEVIDKLRKWSR